MREFIERTNRYLLERHPNLWNTRFVWMVGAAIVLHILFFALGYVGLSNPQSLQARYAPDLFFDSGLVLFSTIISILILVVWLLFLFKNNAFKNFYPTSNLALFKQFFLYLLIIFSCISFYFSYNAGMKTFIAKTYQDEDLFEQFDISNKAAIFFSNSLANYTLDQKRYPEAFLNHYCETNVGQMHLGLPYLQFKDLRYQYYTFATRTFKPNDYRNTEHLQGYIYRITSEDSITYFFKDSVVDFSSKVSSAKPNYSNYSDIFYSSRRKKNDVESLTDLDNNSAYGYEGYYDYQDGSYTKTRSNISRQTQEFLETSTRADIQKLLNEFIGIMDFYKVEYELNPQDWMDIIYASNNFEVRKFIRNQPKTEYDGDFMYEDDYYYEETYDYEDSYETIDTSAYNQATNSSDTIVDNNKQNGKKILDSINKAIEARRAVPPSSPAGRLSESQKYFSDNLTDFYIRKDKLHNVFENIEDIKQRPFFEDSIHFYLWTAFFMASLIFAFRLTGLRSLLFSILTVGVLILFVALIGVALSYSIGGSDDYLRYFLSYLTLFIATLILIIPIIFATKLKKSIVAICLNISVIMWPLYLLMIVAIVSMHQQDICDQTYYAIDETQDCQVLLQILGFNLSWMLFILGLAFMVIYAPIIKRWKALPEG